MFFDATTLRILGPGLVWGLAGGFLAALLPAKSEGTGGAWGSIVTILIGMVVGGVGSMILTHHWFVWLEDGGKVGVEATVAFLGKRTLRRLQAIGPGDLLAWLVRRGQPGPILPKEHDNGSS